MRTLFCYITVFQAMKLFAHLRTRRESRLVENSLAAMKMLGVNARSAPGYGRLLATSRDLDPLNVLAAGLCLESGLPLLTNRRDEFRGIRGLAFIDPARLMKQSKLSAQFIEGSL
jgi:hypothetical protein